MTDFIKHSTTAVNNDRMLQAPAAERNKEPILDVLKKYFQADTTGQILEIASGTGQHVSHFAKYYRNITWNPSEIEDKSILR